MAFKCPVPGCEDSEKEFQTEAAAKVVDADQKPYPKHAPGFSGGEGLIQGGTHCRGILRHYRTGWG